MRISRAGFLRAASAFAGLGFAGALPSRAAQRESVEQFYRGKTISLLIGTEPSFALIVRVETSLIVSPSTSTS